MLACRRNLRDSALPAWIVGTTVTRGRDHLMRAQFDMACGTKCHLHSISPFVALASGGWYHLALSALCTPLLRSFLRTRLNKAKLPANTRAARGPSGRSVPSTKSALHWTFLRLAGVQRGHQALAKCLLVSISLCARTVSQTLCSSASTGGWISLPPALCKFPNSTRSNSPPFTQSIYVRLDTFPSFR